MKKIWNGLFIAGLLAGIVGCGDCDCPKLKECQEKLAAYEDGGDTKALQVAEAYEVEYDSTLIVPDVSAKVVDNYTNVKPIGKLSDGTAGNDGYNISVKKESFSVTFMLIWKKGNKVIQGKAYDITDSEGFEIWVKDDSLYVIKSAAEFANSTSLEIGAGQEDKFDTKVSIANPSVPSIVGSNDARDAKQDFGEGVIASLLVQHVRLNSSVSSGVYELVVSGQTTMPTYGAKLEFAKLGVPRWGADFKTVR